MLDNADIANAISPQKSNIHIAEETTVKKECEKRNEIFRVRHLISLPQRFFVVILTFVLFQRRSSTEPLKITAFFRTVKLLSFYDNDRRIKMRNETTNDDEMSTNATTHSMTPRTSEKVRETI